ncbi:MAG: SDR family oxidoreductase [Alphaproteobacteria bacterium]|nr:SDR family oxidoreductase [Alphaproteobacteria bacterium]
MVKDTGSKGSGALAGQKAIVTGASSGLGAQIARTFAAAGATVGVNHVGDGAATEAIIKGIRDAGGSARPLEADVSVESEVAAMVEAFVAAEGRLDILVANAGIQRDASVVEMSLAQWQRVIDVNLTGQFLCARAAIRRFLRQGPQPDVSRATGKIICMSSVHQVIPWAGHVNYAASKGGVMMLMQSLAQEVAPHRIRVNAIAPGAIRTPINRPAWETPEAEKRLRTLIPYDRVGEPDDIAKAALWLASDDSDYVTGTTIFVDGGMTLYPGFADNG